MCHSPALHRSALPEDLAFAENLPLPPKPTPPPAKMMEAPPGSDQRKDSVYLLGASEKEATLQVGKVLLAGCDRGIWWKLQATIF